MVHQLIYQKFDKWFYGFLQIVISDRIIETYQDNDLSYKEKRSVFGNKTGIHKFETVSYHRLAVNEHHFF